jgi:uncharacterized membrane protein
MGVARQILFAKSQGGSFFMNTRTVAVCVVTAALITVLSIIPPAWGIPYLGWLPVLVAISVCRDIRVALFAGLCAGFVSWILAYIRPSIVGAVFQTNPLLPIVPRVLAAVLAHYACVLTYVYMHRRKREYLQAHARTISAIACAAVGSMATTVLVLGAIVLFVPAAYANHVSIWAYLTPIIPVAITELVINVAVTPSIVRSIKLNKTAHKP